MQSKPKANSIITSVYDAERNVIKFTVLGQGEMELDLNKVSKENLAYAAVHGFNQRIPDGAAIGATDKDGDIIPKAERTRIKFERMQDLCRHYESGTAEWSRKGDGTPRTSDVVEAIARIQDISYDEAIAMIEARAEKVGRTVKAQMAELRKSPTVAKAILDMKRERLESRAPAVNADEELANLKGE